MSSEKTRVTVDIYGTQYTMVGDSSTKISYLQMVAAHVNEHMNNIGREYARLDTVKIAVLAAVNIADEYFKSQSELEQFEKEFKLLGSMKEQFEKTQIEYSALQDEYQALNSHCTELKEQNQALNLEREKMKQEVEQLTDQLNVQSGDTDNRWKMEYEQLKEEYTKLKTEYNEWIELVEKDIPVE